MNLTVIALSAVKEKMSASNFQLDPDFLPRGMADKYLQQLLNDIEWRQDTLKLYGREHRIPRQHQWYADSGVNYCWSGIKMQPLNWIAPLNRLRERLRKKTGFVFNSVLANLYRDGNDSMGWHSDDERELGIEPVIASISLGAERDFHLRQKNRGTGKSSGCTRSISLPHGSLLLMSGSSQRNWQHALPKRRRISEPRINLTFRLIIT
ncbi:MAG: alpha-ketoglutarate-dependent dioxygenase AlkB [Gammaproteobacteria bacterium]|nr:MAG: alpha-ketoglutarate-dependent dioxygenase AlkB [Gammaproteobacteria bacterium]